EQTTKEGSQQRADAEAQRPAEDRADTAAGQAADSTCGIATRKSVDNRKQSAANAKQAAERTTTTATNRAQRVGEKSAIGEAWPCYARRCTAEAYTAASK